MTTNEATISIQLSFKNNFLSNRFPMINTRRKRKREKKEREGEERERGRREMEREYLL